MIRTGLGVDSHRLTPGRPLILGGVEIPSELGLDGHSDADVLTHAIIDALLGAAGLGDIGTHFPDTAAEWKDADSLELLRSVVSLLADEGWRVEWVDATVMLETPKLAPHREAILGSLEPLIGPWSLKATTAERLGALGRGEGAAALAIATIHRQ